MSYTIIPLNLGEVELDEKSKMTYFKNFGKKVQIVYIAWLIKGNEKNILIDSGVGDADWAKIHRGINLKPGPQGGFVTTLAKFGIKPEEIDLVICTHLHWDHCVNHHYLTNAKFIVQHRELMHAIDPINVQKDIYGWAENQVPPFLSVSGKYRTIKGDREVLPGIKVVLTPGHTPGTQGVLVKTGMKDFFLASDSVPLFENWEERTPSGIHVNLEEYQESFEKIETLSGVFVLPGHDPKVFEKERYP
jgi:N-acyl homoserine lactone hydrolase